jgi:hypothetical protein
MQKIIRVDFQNKTSESLSELTPVDRLKLKVADMAVQTEIMRNEVKEFKANIKLMDESAGKLGDVIKEYSTALGNIKTGRLRRKSYRLAGIMDRYLISQSAMA